MKYTTNSSLNSNIKKAEIVEKNNERLPVVSKPAKVKKKGMARELVDEFVPDDMGVVKNTILRNVLVPTIKSIVMSVIDILLNDGKGNTKTYNMSSGRSINGSKYRSSLDDYGTSLRASNEIRSPSINTYILYDTRDDAQRVLDEMFDIVNIGGVVSVAEYYNFSHLPSPDYPYSSYGWDRNLLIGTKIVFEYDYQDKEMKYRLELRKPVPIKRIR